MELNADFSERVVIRPEDYASVDSPASGVRRMMLDRIGDEVARATTIVNFAPDSYFDAHGHELGEEYFVLDGVFSDESGDYRAGSYVRNPPGSSHKPFTREGATIFVKLRQFDPMDLAHTVIDTTAAAFSPGVADGLSVLPLHQAGHESVALVRWEPGTRFSTHRHWGGEEIFVLDGVFEDEHGRYPKGTWLRSPHMSQHTLLDGRLSDLRENRPSARLDRRQ